MIKCPKCGGSLVRIHRGRIEKILFAEKHRCRECKLRVRTPWAFLEPSEWFVSSRHTKCIRCGSLSIQLLEKRDRVDPMSRHPLSRLLRILGGRVYFCGPCRLQYYDWRPIHVPDQKAPDPESGLPGPGGDSEPA